MTSPRPGMREFFATAHALNLQQKHSDTFSSKPHPVGKQENLALFETIEQMLRHMGDFDAMAPVDESGLPFIQALLRADNPLPVSWVSGWVERAGAHTIFEGAPFGHDILTYWMEERLIRKLLDESLYQAKNDVPLAVWLIEKSPGWDPSQASLWMEKIQALPARDMADFKPLADAIENRGVVLSDPRRSPDRWLSQDQFGNLPLSGEDLKALLAKTVSCPSGKDRPLGDLLSLRFSKPDIGSLEFPLFPLPELPHKRRDELARSWVMDPDVSLDIARARLWAAILNKEDVFYVLLSDYANAQIFDPVKATRMADMFKARDPAGRSLVALLTLKKKDNWISLLIDRGLADYEDVLADNGAGLIEQCLPDLLGISRGRLEFSLPSDLPLTDIVMGPFSRYENWADMLVDRISLTGESMLWGMKNLERIVEAMDLSPFRDRIEDCICISRFNNLLGVKSFNSYPDDKASKALNSRALDCLRELNKSLDVLKSRGFAIDVGVDEWRQWATVSGLDNVIAKKPIWMVAAVHQGIIEAEKILSIRALERDLGRAEIPEDRIAKPRGIRL